MKNVQFLTGHWGNLSFLRSFGNFLFQQLQVKDFNFCQMKINNYQVICVFGHSRSLTTILFQLFFFYINIYQVIGVFGHSWSLLKEFIHFFKIWTYTRSLVFWSLLEFNKYFLFKLFVFYMKRYQVIGVFGHSWVWQIFCSNCLFFHINRYQVIGVLVTLEWSKYFVQFFLYEYIPGNWCFWSLLKFIKYFVQIGLLIWTYTRSLVFLVTLEFSKYFVLFYMNMYQVIGVFGHSWSLFNILFKLFLQYEY